MAEERNLTGSPRRKPLVVGLVVAGSLLAIGATLLLGRDDDPTPRALPIREESATGDGDVADPDTPSFRFRTTDRTLIPTAAGSVRERARAKGVEATRAVTGLLTELYVEGFLDPDNWREARYEDAFRIFARSAVARAEALTRVLTAGADAGERFEQILPVGGRVATRILLDRTGKPALVVAEVRFRAEARGDDVATLRSTGQFFFERIEGRWKVISFDVSRDDVTGSTG